MSRNFFSLIKDWVRASWDVVLGPLLILALIALGFFITAYEGANNDIQGKIINKDFTRVESSYGSRLIYYVIVQDNSGKQIKVEMSESRYQRLQVGMEVKVTNQVIQIVEKP